MPGLCGWLCGSIDILGPYWRSLGACRRFARRGQGVRHRDVAPEVARMKRGDIRTTKGPRGLMWLVVATWEDAFVTIPSLAPLRFTRAAIHKRNLVPTERDAQGEPDVPSVQWDGNPHRDGEKAKGSASLEQECRGCPALSAWPRRLGRRGPVVSFPRDETEMASLVHVAAPKASGTGWLARRSASIVPRFPGSCHAVPVGLFEAWCFARDCWHCGQRG